MRSRIASTSITAYSSFILSAPKIAASGIMPNMRVRPMSLAIRIGRRRMRSTHTPTNRLSTSVGTVPAAASKPICMGVALSAITAAKLIATSPIRVPNSDTVSPAHSFMKSRWRNSTLRRRAAGWFGSELFSFGSIEIPSRNSIARKTKEPRASTPEALSSQSSKYPSPGGGGSAEVDEGDVHWMLALWRSREIIAAPRRCQASRPLGSVDHFGR